MYDVRTGDLLSSTITLICFLSFMTHTDINHPAPTYNISLPFWILLLKGHRDMNFYIRHTFFNIKNLQNHKSQPSEIQYSPLIHTLPDIAESVSNRT